MAGKGATGRVTRECRALGECAALSPACRRRSKTIHASTRHARTTHAGRAAGGRGGGLAECVPCSRDGRAREPRYGMEGYCAQSAAQSGREGRKGRTLLSSTIEHHAVSHTYLLSTRRSSCQSQAERLRAIEQRRAHTVVAPLSAVDGAFRGTWQRGPTAHIAQSRSAKECGQEGGEWCVTASGRSVFTVVALFSVKKHNNAGVHSSAPVGRRRRL